MTHDEHKQLHADFHRSLDGMVADFINQTGALPSKTTLFDFMKWSAEQAKNPTEKQS